MMMDIAPHCEICLTFLRCLLHQTAPPSTGIASCQPLENSSEQSGLSHWSVKSWYLFTLTPPIMLPCGTLQSFSHLRQSLTHSKGSSIQLPNMRRASGSFPFAFDPVHGGNNPDLPKNDVFSSMIRLQLRDGYVISYIIWGEKRDTSFSAILQHHHLRDWGHA